jgi:hypothetical protein
MIGSTGAGSAGGAREEPGVSGKELGSHLSLLTTVAAASLRPARRHCPGAVLETGFADM